MEFQKWRNSYQNFRNERLGELLKELVADLPGITSTETFMRNKFPEEVLGELPEELLNISLQKYVDFPKELLGVFLEELP